MQKNYIILAHKNPEQIRHLVNRLNDDKSNFYIHVDKNIDIKPFKEMIPNLLNVFFIKNREEGTWGDLGIVKGTINCLKEATKNSTEGYCILLSGQDYPIKTREQINTFLNQNKGLEFIDICSLENVLNTQEWKKKLTFYKYNLSNKRDDYVLFPLFLSTDFFTIQTLKNIVKIFIRKKGITQLPFILSNLFKTRKAPYNIRPYAGGQWWALTNDSCKKIISFLNNSPNFIEYHKFTLLPDEIFFQSILMHLAGKKNHEFKFGNSFTYVNWTRQNCVLPVTFKDIDFEELIYQPENMLFARKFDFNLDRKIFHKLDNLESTT